ncbi:hypothetical protein PVAP13_7KG053145 [Panicum virgatum]|uniref:Uncharacterized protein n=1 Tax=Panicum virgatum TaxID=38727 RepID=A0A8T0Q6R5_PANVG|nr:hypothetical protein PVAP13_7KG053145 [Panicum virgatum]
MIGVDGFIGSHLCKKLMAETHHVASSPSTSTAIRSATLSTPRGRTSPADRWQMFWFRVDGCRVQVQFLWQVRLEPEVLIGIPCQRTQHHVVRARRPWCVDDSSSRRLALWPIKFNQQKKLFCVGVRRH